MTKQATKKHGITNTSKCTNNNHPSSIQTTKRPPHNNPIHHNKTKSTIQKHHARRPSSNSIKPTEQTPFRFDPPGKTRQTGLGDHQIVILARVPRAHAARCATIVQPLHNASYVRRLKA